MTSLKKANPNAPALTATGPRNISVLAGTCFNGVSFNTDTSVEFDPEMLQAGRDYAVTVADGMAGVTELTSATLADNVFGGFHFAPGGNAIARAGGGSIPAINPHSIWDRNFRPECPDPRGMTLVEVPDGKSFWCDIYLTAAEHALGTSRWGVMQATGNMWTWGHDGDPDMPRASIFGGSWLRDDYAGSRSAYLVYWPDHSSADIGARGRSDHLQLD